MIFGIRRRTNWKARNPVLTKTTSKLAADVRESFAGFDATLGSLRLKPQGEPQGPKRPSLV